VATGSSWVSWLRLPRAVDYVKLPCVTKVADNEYEAKTLGIEFDAIRSIRESIIFATAVSFLPHLVFVDNVPLGMKGEMIPTLHNLREQRPDARVITDRRFRVGFWRDTAAPMTDHQPGSRSSTRRCLEQQSN
jgi:predicted glycosyltransferase